MQMNVLNIIKKHLMTGISYMIPVVVAAGLCIAVGTAIGGPNVSAATNTIPWMIATVGSTAMTLAVPVLTAFIAFSIADRPGIAPGLVLGLISNNLKAGFLGGMLAGFLVGYLIIGIRKYIKVPKSLQGLMPIIIIPFLATLIAGFLMYIGLSQPIAWAQAAITTHLQNMQAGGAKFSLGAIIGGMMGFDFGGPVNKTASAFCTALMTSKIYGPTSAKLVGGMTPALGIGTAVLLGGKKRWNGAQREAAKAAIPLGFCYITEGVLPFAAADPIRVIISSCVGSAVAGGLTQIWNVSCDVPHGGIFVVPLMQNPLGFLAALVVGSVITFALYYALRFRVNAAEKEEEDESALDNLEISI